MYQISVDRIARETDEAKIEKQREALSAQLTTMDELLPVSSTTTTRPTPRRTRWWCTAAYAVDEDARALYELGVIVVRDAKHLTARLDDEKREDVEDETQEQLAFADIVLLNKIDIVPEEAELQKIEARIREVNPQHADPALAAQRGGREAAAVRGRHRRAARARVRARAPDEPRRAQARRDGHLGVSQQRGRAAGQGEAGLDRAPRGAAGRRPLPIQWRVRGHQAQLVAEPKFGGDVNHVRYNEYNAIAVAGSELQR